jgi:addiction module HigA family antidote
MARRRRDDAVYAFPYGVPLPPIHPGRTVADELATRGISAHAAALKMRIPPGRLSEIINGKRGISAVTALRLGRFFGTGPVIWMNLQSAYALALAAQQVGEQVEREVAAA